MLDKKKNNNPWWIDLPLTKHPDMLWNINKEENLGIKEVAFAGGEPANPITWNQTSTPLYIPRAKFEGDVTDIFHKLIARTARILRAKYQIIMDDKLSAEKISISNYVTFDYSKEKDPAAVSFDYGNKSISALHPYTMPSLATLFFFNLYPGMFDQIRRNNLKDQTSENATIYIYGLIVENNEDIIPCIYYDHNKDVFTIDCIFSINQVFTKSDIIPVIRR